MQAKEKSAPMVRPKIVSSLQKTYDECYFTCSTAVFFEGKVFAALSVF